MAGWLSTSSYFSFPPSSFLVLLPRPPSSLPPLPSRIFPSSLPFLLLALSEGPSPLLSSPCQSPSSSPSSLSPVPLRRGPQFGFAAMPQGSAGHLESSIPRYRGWAEERVRVGDAVFQKYGGKDRPRAAWGRGHRQGRKRLVGSALSVRGVHHHWPGGLSGPLWAARALPRIMPTWSSQRPKP